MTVSKVSNRGFPCFTPDSTLNYSVSSWFVFAFVLVLVRISSLSLINLMGIYIAPNILSVYSTCTKSKAFV